jgi:tripartite-type tricarboxylate transporter receptor subunit TctC
MVWREVLLEKILIILMGGIPMKTGMIAFIVLLVVFTSFYDLDFLMAAELSYPKRPIEIIVGYGPGGGTDLGVRAIAPNSKKFLGQELVILNKPGGAGRVGMTLLAKAKPDGYTLGAVTDTSIIMTPHLEKVPYKPIEDFTFITQYGVLNNAIVVLSDSPYRTLKELIEFARANPGKLTVGTAGAGSTGYVVFEAISLLEGLQIKLVPFSGAAAGVTALLGGHVMAATLASSGVSPHLQAGKIKLLALMGSERVDNFPGVPTLKEVGYPLEFQSWYIIAGPKNMEKPIVKKLDEVFRKAMESPEFIKLADELEIRAKNPLSCDELTQGIVRRYDTSGKLFKRLGMGIK